MYVFTTKWLKLYPKWLTFSRRFLRNILKNLIDTFNNLPMPNARENWTIKIFFSFSTVLYNWFFSNFDQYFWCEIVLVFYNITNEMLNSIIYLQNWIIKLCNVIISNVRTLITFYNDWIYYFKSSIGNFMCSGILLVLCSIMNTYVFVLNGYHI